MILASTRSKEKLHVDWWLMNHCNYNCSYCADIIKNSSIELPNIKDCCDFIDKLKQHAVSINKNVEFNITGGEVTQWTFLPDLLEKIQRSGFVSTIRSNASSSISEWTKILEHVNCVRLEFHPEHQNLSHFAMIVAATMKANVHCSLTINMIPERWQELEQMIDKIKNLYPDLSIQKKMLFSDPLEKTNPLPYTEPQIKQFENQSGDLIFYENGISTRTDFQTLIIHGKNKFAGDHCYAGLEQLIIDAWGRVYRGHCRQGGKIGTVNKDIKFPIEPVACKKPTCDNGFDILATKIRSS